MLQCIHDDHGDVQLLEGRKQIFISGALLHNKCTCSGWESPEMMSMGLQATKESNAGEFCYMTDLYKINFVWTLTKFKYKGITKLPFT